MNVGLIIPCYNISSKIDNDKIEFLINNYRNFHLCFVNNGSKDDSLSALNSFKDKHFDRITVIDIKKKLSKTAAIRAGTRFYYSHNIVDYVGIIDIDLSIDFKELSNLIEKLHSKRNLIMVLGSRNIKSKYIKTKLTNTLLTSLLINFSTYMFKTPLKIIDFDIIIFRAKFIPIMYGSEFISNHTSYIEIFLRLKKYFKNKEIMKYILKHPLKHYNQPKEFKFSINNEFKKVINLSKFGIRT